MEVLVSDVYARGVTIDRNDPRPPYQQVADDLRRRIGAGEFGPGDRLPSIRQLAEEYGISAQTVQNGLRELRQEGLVVSQQGRAFFVRDPDRPIGGASSVSERLDSMEAELRELRERVASLEAGGADGAR
jgi:DNA-binding GntR family transcriptional regulator